MERLIRILICLADDDRARGVPIARLMRMADLTEDTEAARAQLRRDLTILRQGGWDIRNVAGEGEDGRYVMHVRDNRLALLLTPGERAALRALLYLDDIDHAKPPPFLGTLAHAIRDRSLISFRYGGKARMVHPDGLSATRSGWVLTAREEAESDPKEYATAWMADVAIRGPGTAAPEIELPAERLDSMLWQLDPPMVVRLGVVPVFVADVLGLLPQAVVLETTERDGDEVIVELTVTNQASFRARLYSLGLRARVLEPPELAGEIIGNLHAVIRSSS